MNERLHAPYEKVLSAHPGGCLHKSERPTFAIGFDLQELLYDPYLALQNGDIVSRADQPTMIEPDALIVWIRVHRVLKQFEL